MKLYKASPVGDMKVPDLRLVATRAHDEHVSLAATARHHKAQGALLADALLASLPGGTIDALLIELLDHHRSLLVIPHRPRGRKA